MYLRRRDELIGMNRFRQARLCLLSVGLHVALLEVGGEAVHVLIVRKKRVGLGAVEVAIPHSE